MCAVRRSWWSACTKLGCRLPLFEGREIPGPPPQEEVVAVVREHFHLLREHFREHDRQAILRMRKFGAWYASGFPGAAEFRRRFQRVDSEEDLEEILGAWPKPEPEAEPLASELVRDYQALWDHTENSSSRVLKRLASGGVTPLEFRSVWNQYKSAESEFRNEIESNHQFFTPQD